MSLDISKLEKVKKLGPIIQARCPACWEQQLDKSGNHLRIFADGRFGCAMQPGDRQHYKRIWELAHGADPIKRERRIEYRAPQRPKIDVRIIMQAWAEKTTDAMIDNLAGQLGVTSESLREIGAVWSAEHKAWAFPMRNGNGEPIGIRLRNEAGRKWAVEGSHAGLIIPNYMLTNSFRMGHYRK